MEIANKVQISQVNYTLSRKSSTYRLPIHSDKRVNHLTVKLDNGKTFDIEIDKEGDVVITGSGNLKVLSKHENELIFGIKESSLDM